MYLKNDYDVSELTFLEKVKTRKCKALKIVIESVLMFKLKVR